MNCSISVFFSFLIIISCFITPKAYADEFGFTVHCNQTQNQDSRYTIRVILRSLKEDDCDLALKKLKGLSQISLPREGFKSLEPFSGLVNMTGLDLAGNEIVDASPLASMIEVQTLLLNNNKIESLEFAENLPFLKTLKLADNNIKSLSPLKENGSIEILNLMGNSSISDMASLAHLPLVSLNISKVKLTDTYDLLLPQARMNNLDLSATELQNIESLARPKVLPAIRKLLVQDNHIEDMAPLGELSTLRVLNVSRNPIKDLSPISKLTNLVALDVSGVQASNLLENLNHPRLLELYAAKLNLKDLGWVEELNSAFRTLDLSHNQIKDISPLYRLKDLGNLQLQGNPIDDLDLEWLASLKNLKIFNIDIKKIKSKEKRKKLLELKALIFERSRK